MTHYLPQKIMTFFAAGAPIKHLPWEEKPKPPANITGVAELMERLQKPLPERVINKTKVEVKAERKAEKDKKNDEKNEVAFAEWKERDFADSRYTENPLNTIFVSRLPKSITEAELKAAFEASGKIRKVVIPKDTMGISRGYAFIEYETEAGFRHAYDHADGAKIGGRKVVVDIERGRTHSDWKPRRLGGGLGMTRAGKPKDCVMDARRIEFGSLEEKQKALEKKMMTSAMQYGIGLGGMGPGVGGGIGMGMGRERGRERGDDRRRDDRRREGDFERDRGDRFRERDRDRDRDRERERERRGGRSPSPRRRRSRSRSGSRSRDRYWSGDRDRTRERGHERGGGRERERERGERGERVDRGRERSKSRSRPRERENERDRERERERERR